MVLRVFVLPVLAAFLALTLGCNADNGPQTLDSVEKDSKTISDSQTGDEPDDDVLSDVEQDRQQPDDGIVADDDGTVSGDDGVVADDDGTVSGDDGVVADDDGPVADDDGTVTDDDGNESLQCVQDADCDQEPKQCHEFKCEAGECKEVPVDNNKPCSDGNFCTDPDTCQDGECVSGPTIDCDDNNECTEDSCDPASGCDNDPISTDEMVSCGVGECFREVPKCTDGVLNVCIPGPVDTEICGDEKDNDCDGETDEAGATGCQMYYKDADGDGFGVFAGPRCLCKASGEYTATKTGDCCDTDAKVYPGVQGWFSTTNMCGNFDYNCDQRAETQTGQGSCVWTGHACLTQTGFENVVPACGQSGNYITDCVDTGSGCRANTRTRVQGCR